ncbi:MAG: hypothetical protein EOP48_32475 [Sphingobacteriales bacterium]|nr:MAG: hypothetical protein EOP48_32475 [Sphingobacteriales bacterium]
MRISLQYLFLLFSMLILFACSDRKKADEQRIRIIKGLYVLGPELRSFTNCTDGAEYWVADSSKTLELAYSSLNFEKPYEPVYVELRCRIVASDTTSVADFDSTLVVQKVLKIDRNIPPGICSQ